MHCLSVVFERTGTAAASCSPYRPRQHLFPLLLDRNVGAIVALLTLIRLAFNAFEGAR
jgi:hypothetical protein